MAFGLKKKSPSISSAGSESENPEGYSSNNSAASMRSCSRQSNDMSVASDASSYDEEENLNNRGSPSNFKAANQSIRSIVGLARVVHSTIAKLKKRGGCPIATLKRDIKDNYGYTLTGTHNTRRLNTVLKTLQKDGKLVKTQKGYKLVPISELRRRRHRRGRRRRRRRGRRRHRKYRRRRGRRRRRRHRRRGRRHRRYRRHRGRSRKNTVSAPKSRRIQTRRAANNLLASGGTPPFPLGGPSRGGGSGKFTPGKTSPRIPSRSTSKVQSRLPSRLPSRSHSPMRAGFDPCETPPTRSRRSSARNSPGPQLRSSLDDYDL